jgi:hypothetical protein
VLVCEECGRVAPDNAKGWRAFLGVDVNEEEEGTRVYIFCPECAEREFGPPRSDIRG